MRYEEESSGFRGSCDLRFDGDVCASRLRWLVIICVDGFCICIGKQRSYGGEQRVGECRCVSCECVSCECVGGECVGGE